MREVTMFYRHAAKVYSQGEQQSKRSRIYQDVRRPISSKCPTEVTSYSITLINLHTRIKGDTRSQQKWSHSHVPPLTHVLIMPRTFTRDKSLLKSKKVARALLLGIRPDREKFGRKTDQQAPK